MGRTIREFSVPADCGRTRSSILSWLRRNKFNVLEEESAGEPMELSIKGFKVRLTTRPGSIVALRGGRLGMIAFEISPHPEGEGCLIHGEFYAAGAKGRGIVGFLGMEWEVSEKPDFVGRLPRKKGFALMNRFISELVEELSR